jgi:hypothetical protein
MSDGREPVDVQIALVFAAIAEIMAMSQNPPDIRTKAEGVREDLEDDVTVRSAVAGMSEGGQTQCVRGVVSEIEATLR